MKRKYLQFFIITLLVVGTPFFFLGGPGYHSHRSFKFFWDLGHVLFFFLVTCSCYGSLTAKGTRNPSWRLLTGLFLVILVVGIAIELIQMHLHGRSPDPFDVLRNLLGMFLAVSFVIAPHLFRQKWKNRLIQFVAIGLLGCACWPVTRAVVDEQLMARQFPLLSDFETPFEISRWMRAKQIKVQSDIVRHGKKAAAIQLTTKKYSGVALFHFLGDWQGYTWLHASVYNPYSRPVELHCRIHDILHQEHHSKFHDRFNTHFSLHTGWNDLQISLDDVKNAPRTRSMDMAHIQGLGFFVIQEKERLTLYLDNVYLSK